MNKLLDAATKTWVDAAKTASKKVAHKTAESTGELPGNKIAEKKLRDQNLCLNWIRKTV